MKPENGWREDAGPVPTMTHDNQASHEKHKHAFTTEGDAEKRFVNRKNE